MPLVPARGRAEVALGLHHQTFLIYRTCMRCAPANPVPKYFLQTCLSKNMTFARPQRNAKPSEHLLHISQFCASHSTLSSHLTSSEIFPSRPISFHVIEVSSSQQFSPNPNTDQPFSSPRRSSQLISAVLQATKLLLSETVSCTKNTGHRSLRHKCILTEKHA